MPFWHPHIDSVLRQTSCTLSLHVGHVKICPVKLSAQHPQIRVRGAKNFVGVPVVAGTGYGRGPGCKGAAGSTSEKRHPSRFAHCLAAQETCVLYRETFGPFAPVFRKVVVSATARKWAHSVPSSGHNHTGGITEYNSSEWKRKGRWVLFPCQEDRATNTWGSGRLLMLMVCQKQTTALQVYNLNRHWCSQQHSTSAALWESAGQCTSRLGGFLIWDSIRFASRW